MKKNPGRKERRRMEKGGHGGSRAPFRLHKRAVRRRDKIARASRRRNLR